MFLRGCITKNPFKIMGVPTTIATRELPYAYDYLVKKHRTDTCSNLVNNLSALKMLEITGAYFITTAVARRMRRRELIRAMLED